MHSNLISSKRKKKISILSVNVNQSQVSILLRCSGLLELHAEVIWEKLAGKKTHKQVEFYNTLHLFSDNEMKLKATIVHTYEELN